MIHGDTGLVAACELIIEFVKKHRSEIGSEVARARIELELAATNRCRVKPGLERDSAVFAVALATISKIVDTMVAAEATMQMEGLFSELKEVLELELPKGKGRA